MPLLQRSCCGCCALYMGTKIISYACLIIYIIFLVCSAWLLAHSFLKDDTEKHSNIENAAAPISLVLLVMLVFLIVASGILLYGLEHNRRHLLLPWIVGKTLITLAVLIAYLVLIVIVTNSDEKKTTKISLVWYGVPVLIITGLFMYMLVIVISCYQEMGLSHPAVSYSVYKGSVITE